VDTAGHNPASRVRYGVPGTPLVSPELFEAWLTSQSVRRPDRVADLFAPGFRLDGL